MLYKSKLALFWTQTHTRTQRRRGRIRRAGVNTYKPRASWRTGQQALPSLSFSLSLNVTARERERERDLCGPAVGRKEKCCHVLLPSRTEPIGPSSGPRRALLFPQTVGRGWGGGVWISQSETETFKSIVRESRARSWDRVFYRRLIYIYIYIIYIHTVYTMSYMWKDLCSCVCVCAMYV